MATIRLTNQRNPTLTEVALAEIVPAMPDLTREQVIGACKLRGIPVRDGRVLLGDSTTRLADLYFGLREARGDPVQVAS